MADPTPEDGATLIFANGPLSTAEIRKLPMDRAYEYFQVMRACLDELGLDGMVQRRAELREAVLRKIVNRPEGA